MTTGSGTPSHIPRASKQGNWAIHPIHTRELETKGTGPHPDIANTGTGQSSLSFLATGWFPHPHFLEISPRLALSSGIGSDRGGSAR